MCSPVVPLRLGKRELFCGSLEPGQRKGAERRVLSPEAAVLCQDGRVVSDAVPRLCPGGEAATQAVLFLCQLSTRPLHGPLSPLSVHSYTQTQHFHSLLASISAVLCAFSPTYHKTESAVARIYCCTLDSF